MICSSSSQSAFPVTPGSRHRAHAGFLFAQFMNLYEYICLKVNNYLQVVKEATAATAPNAVAKDPRQRSLEIKQAAKHPAKQTLCFAITRLSLSCRARKLLQTSSGAIDESVRCIRLRLHTGSSLGPLVALVGRYVAATCVLWQFDIPSFASLPASKFVCSVMWFEL